MSFWVSSLPSYAKIDTSLLEYRTVTTPISATEFSRFSQLPPELRELIYDYCTPHDSISHPRRLWIKLPLEHPSSLHCPCLRHPLLQTFRESRKAVFKRIGAHHALWFSPHTSNIDGLLWSLSLIDPFLLASFTKLHIRADRWLPAATVSIHIRIRATTTPKFLNFITEGSATPEASQREWVRSIRCLRHLLTLLSIVIRTKLLEEKLVPIIESLPRIKGRWSLTKDGLLALIDLVGW
jgi:hypothetical protein